jgi:hypothetical protein
MNQYSRPVKECPIGHHVNYKSCADCDYCERIGFCAHPVMINKLIEIGQEKPMSHDYAWPEREENYLKRMTGGGGA